MSRTPGGTLFSNNIYKNKVNLQQASPPKRGLITNKIEFYQTKKKALGDGLKRYQLGGHQKKVSGQLAATPGLFFHNRHHRDNSMPAQLNLDTHSPNNIANFPSTVPTGSKSFLNYINARERAVAVAKDQIDKLNESAVKKLKNEHLATKAAKEARAM